MAQLPNIEDFAALEKYLHQSGHIADETDAAFQILSGGVSNRVVLVELSTGEMWVIKQALEKLRVQVDWRCAPERSEREALALSLLARLAPPNSITTLMFADRQNHLLAMEAVPAPHANWKELLLSGVIMPAHFEAAGILLGTIHRRASEGRIPIPEEFADTAFFHALRVEPYYLYTASVVAETAAFFQALVDEMKTASVTIVHGDFSPKNILIHDERLVLLDHEVVHVGDPAFDVGFFLAHILSKAHHLTTKRDALMHGAELFWEAYDRELAAQSDLWKLEPRAVRHTLGCLLARVAGRSQLEYLSQSERDAQKAAVLSILPNLPATIPKLIRTFLGRVEQRS
jgi:5-methylthioribose kinase